MTAIKIDYPTTCREAILLVRYLRAWNNNQLAAAIGIKSGSQFSRIINHHTPGTDAMRDRVLACLPKSVTSNMA